MRFCLYSQRSFSISSITLWQLPLCNPTQAIIIWLTKQIISLTRPFIIISNSEMFCGIAVPQKMEHSAEIMFTVGSRFNKVTLGNITYRVTLLKRDSGKGIFLESFRFFQSSHSVGHMRICSSGF